MSSVPVQILIEGSKQLISDDDFYFVNIYPQVCEISKYAYLLKISVNTHIY